MSRLSSETRQEIFDYYEANNILWCGNLEDTAFLGRLYDLKALGSSDARYTSALNDIWQHRERNHDWEDNWIYSDPRFNLLHCEDIKFLKFICETLHPMIRDSDEAEGIRSTLNNLLKQYDYVIEEKRTVLGMISYTARECKILGVSTEGCARTVITEIDSVYIESQIQRMSDAIDEDQESAIGTAKDFVETICKHILDERAVSYNKTDNISELVGSVRRELKLVPEVVTEAKKGADVIKRVLGSLGSVSQGIAELRGLYGTGHGKGKDHSGLGARHARLAVNCAIALGVFLWETHKENESSSCT